MSGIAWTMHICMYACSTLHPTDFSRKTEEKQGMTIVDPCGRQLVLPGNVF